MEASGAVQLMELPCSSRKTLAHITFSPNLSDPSSSMCLIKAVLCVESRLQIKWFWLRALSVASSAVSESSEVSEPSGSSDSLAAFLVDLLGGLSRASSMVSSQSVSESSGCFLRG